MSDTTVSVTDTQCREVSRGADSMEVKDGVLVGRLGLAIHSSDLTL